MAAIYWNPENTATGSYTLKGTFKLIKSTGHDEYVRAHLYGGSGLEGAMQSYIYFMVTDDGTYLIKRRDGASTSGVSPKTPSVAVKKPDASGMATNALEVCAASDKIDFVTSTELRLVTSLPRDRSRRQDRRNSTGCVHQSPARSADRRIQLLEDVGQPLFTPSPARGAGCAHFARLAIGGTARLEGERKPARTAPPLAGLGVKSGCPKPD